MGPSTAINKGRIDILRSGNKTKLSKIRKRSFRLVQLDRCVLIPELKRFSENAGTTSGRKLARILK